MAVNKINYCSRATRGEMLIWAQNNYTEKVKCLLKLRRESASFKCTQSILRILLVVYVLLEVESEYVGLDAVTRFGIYPDQSVAFVEKFLFQGNDDTLNGEDKDDQS